MRRTIAISFLPVAAVLLGATAVEAQWPQFGGARRDFELRGQQPGADFGKSAPELLWKVSLGDGEAQVLVDAGLLYTTYRDGGDEVVVALKPTDGSTVWEHRYAAPISEDLYVKHGDGPHATPTIAGDRICALGIGGRLLCLNKKTGAELWSVDLVRDHGGEPPACGYGASPLAHGKHLIVPAGGEGHAVIAFRLSDGTVAWKSGDFPSGYAAPVLIEVGGEKQVVVFMGQQVAGLDPASGALKWKHDHATSYGVNASLPVWGEDGVLFVSSAYDTGSRALELTREGGKTSVAQLWHQPKMQIHFGNAIRIGGHVYGTSGDFGPVFLTAVDVGSGEIAWQQRDISAKGSMLRLGGNRLLILDEKGKLAVVSVTPDGADVLAEHTLVEGRVWAPPTLVDGTLYVRDRKHVYAFKLG